MPGAPTDDSGYLHEAVLYDSDEDRGVVVPLLQEGAAVGEPCLVALESSTTDPPRPALSRSRHRHPPHRSVKHRLSTPPTSSTLFFTEHVVFRGQRGGHERRDPRSLPGPVPPVEGAGPHCGHRHRPR